MVSFVGNFSCMNKDVLIADPPAAVACCAVFPFCFLASSGMFPFFSNRKVLKAFSYCEKVRSIDFVGRNSGALVVKS